MTVTNTYHHGSVFFCSGRRGLADSAHVRGQERHRRWGRGGGGEVEVEVGGEAVAAERSWEPTALASCRVRGRCHFGSTFFLEGSFAGLIG